MNRIYTFLAATLCSTALFAGEFDRTQEIKGLKNIHNSCFINAAVQLVRGIPELTTTLLGVEKGFYKEGSLADLFVDLLRQMQDKKSTDIDPTLFDIEAWKVLNIDAGTQVDANELIAALLSHLTELDIDKKFLEQQRESSNVQTIELLKSLYTVEKEDIFRNISLEYEQKEAPEKHTGITLEAADLEALEAPSSLTHWLNRAFKPTEAQVRLQNKVITVERQPSLIKTGNYVIFSLERNSWKKDEKTQADEAYRLGTPISFPLKGLRLEPYFATKDTSCKKTYDLMGIIMHSGSGRSGHYVAYIKSGNQWYYCDDERVSKINEKDVAEIAKRGYGVYPGDDIKNRVPTTLLYELFSARGNYPPAQNVALNHLDPNKLFQNDLSAASSSRNAIKSMIQGQTPDTDVFFFKKR